MFTDHQTSYGMGITFEHLPTVSFWTRLSGGQYFWNICDNNVRLGQILHRVFISNNITITTVNLYKKRVKSIERFCFQMYDKIKRTVSIKRKRKATISWRTKYNNALRGVSNNKWGGGVLATYSIVDRELSQGRIAGAIQLGLVQIMANEIKCIEATNKTPSLIRMDILGATYFSS